MMVASTFLADWYPVNGWKCKHSAPIGISKLASPGLILRRRLNAKRSRMMIVKALASPESDDLEEEMEERRRGLPLEAGSAREPSSTLLGFEASLNRLTKWIASGSFCLLILVRRDWEAVWATLGSVLNLLLCYMLKRIFNHKRPTLALRSDPGMPSSHAQSIFFIVSFMIFSIVEWLGTSRVGLLLSACALTLGSYFTWLRVSQKLHSVGQVATGAVVGGSFAILWIWYWKIVVADAVSKLLWVKVLICLCGTSSSVGFLLYVSRRWIRD